MSESTLTARHCGHASLAAVGQRLSQIDLLAPLREKVRIWQKTLKYSPFDKLRAAFILRRWDKKGREQVCVLLSTLTTQAVLSLCGAAQADTSDTATVLAAYAHFYAGRGGGIETGFKQDQQGLDWRNKKRFAAQAMLLWLEALAHNVLIWARAWLTPAAPALADYGLLRLVRDVLAIPGQVYQEANGSIGWLVLSRAHPLAAKLLPALQSLLGPQRTQIRLGEI